MINTQTTTAGRSGAATPGLRMHWVEVRDARGRTHLEARWTDETPTTGMRAPHAA